MLEKQQLPKALRTLERATELDPHRAQFWFYVGWAANEVGNIGKADKALTKALKLDQTLGDAYWQVGRQQEARFQWRRSLSFEPEADQVPLIDAKIERGLTAQPENI